MRKIFVFFLCVLTLTFASCSEEKGIKTTICAHRGYHEGPVLENTLTSFKKAVRLRCGWAELDIWCTKDGEMVVTHDRTLEKVVDQNVVIVDVTKKTLAELREDFSVDRLPTLYDVWKEVGGKINLEIELKDGSSSGISGLLEFFDTYGCYDECIVISFNGNSLEKLKEKDSNIVCGYLSESYCDEMLDYEWADILAIEYPEMTEQNVKAIHQSGKKVFVWTVDSFEEMLELASYGVDSITTNYPNLAIWQILLIMNQNI